MQKIKEQKIWISLAAAGSFNDGERRLCEVNRYDIHGHLLFHESYNGQGKLESRQQYEYNAAGLLLKEYHCFSDNEWDEIHTYFYSENGKLQNIIIRYADNSITDRYHQYDEPTGKFIIEARDEKGNIEEREERELDEDGLILSFAYYRYGELQSQERYFYDEKKREVAEEKYDTNMLIERTELVYDEQDRIKRKQIYDRQGQLSSLIVNETDELGRLVHQLSKDRNHDYNNFQIHHSYNVLDQSHTVRITDREGHIVSEKTTWYDKDRNILRETSGRRSIDPLEISNLPNSGFETRCYEYAFWE